MYQIFKSFNKILINYLKIIQCDFLYFCFRLRQSQLKSYSYRIKVTKMTDFYMLCKWKNQQNQQCIKYLFSLLCVYIYIYIYIYYQVLHDHGNPVQNLCKKKN